MLDVLTNNDGMKVHLENLKQFYWFSKKPKKYYI